MDSNKTNSKLEYLEILRNGRLKGEFTEVEINIPGLHGDHFGSSVEYVTAKRKDGSSVELFVKKMIGNLEQSRRLKEMKVFEKEAGFFNEILPELQAFVKSRTDTLSAEDPFDCIPQCYFADENLIVLENLAMQHFKVFDRSERQDLDHAQMVMKNLAQFHAVSYVLMNEKTSPKCLLAKYPSLEEYLWGEANSRMVNEALAPGLELCAQIIAAYPSEGSSDALNFIQEFLKDISSIVRPIVALNENDICNVINHGDCWNGNIMFLHDQETKQLARQAFVDFQVIRIGSPNLDLGNYMFTSLKHDIRRKEWRNLLKLYYSSFVEKVDEIQGKVMFSFQDFVADFKQKIVPAVILGVSLSCAVECTKEIGNLDEVEGDIICHFQKILSKWFENSPDMVRRNAWELTQIFLEYKELVGI